MAGQQTRGRTSGRAISDGRELASDRRARRKAASERDRPLEQAYNAGLRGEDPAQFQVSDELYGYYQDGQRAAKAQARAERGEQLRGAAGARAGSAASDGAGFVLGLIAYAILANYLRGGVPAVRAWFAAKFLNKTGAGAARPSPVGAPPRPAAPDAVAIRVGA